MFAQINCSQLSFEHESLALSSNNKLCEIASSMINFNLANIQEYDESGSYDESHSESEYDASSAAW